MLTIGQAVGLEDRGTSIPAEFSVSKDKCSMTFCRLLRSRSAKGDLKWLVVSRRDFISTTEVLTGCIPLPQGISVLCLNLPY